MPIFYFTQVHNQQEPSTKGQEGSEPPKWSWVKENTNMTILPSGDQLFLQGSSYTDLLGDSSRFSSAVPFSSVGLELGEAEEPS